MKYINLLEFQNLTVYIYSADKMYDLHNIADFKEFRYDVIERKLVLIWNYPGKWFLKNGDWTNEKLLKSHDLQKVIRQIALIFEEVDNFEVKRRDEELPFSEDSCLSEIYTEEVDLEKDWLKFEFHGERVIYIKANSVRFDNNFYLYEKAR